MTIFPPPLKPGDTIGIAAPSSPFDKELFDRGIETLKRWGYRVSIPVEIYSRNNYLAGSDAGRAKILNRLFADPDINAIVCARGGYGAMRMLRFVDFDAIRKHPKILVGFSDASVLLWALFSRCGVVAFHGPTVTTLAGADDRTLKAFAGLLTADPYPEVYPVKGEVLRPGVAEGPLVGGNLTTLCHLLGTEFAPDFADRILLLEERGEAPYRLDRMLSQMRFSGCLDRVAGVVLGSFESCGSVEEVYRIVMEIFSDRKIPVLAGFDIGHGKTNIALPLGAEAVLNTKWRVLQFSKPLPASID